MECWNAFSNSSTVKREIDLNAHTTKEEVLKAIDGVKLHVKAGVANTKRAVDELILNGFSEANGARTRPSGYPRIGILVTGSQSRVPMDSAVRRVHDADVTMIAVTVGDILNQNGLEATVTHPICQHLILLNNFTEMDSQEYTLRHRIMEGKDGNILCVLYFRMITDNYITPYR